MTDTPTACFTHAPLFQLLEDLSGIGVGDEMLDEGDQFTMFTEEESNYRPALNKARQLCAACPLLEACLFTAVTDQRVKGIAAGTTETDRDRLRSQLGLRPFADEDTDVYLKGRRPKDIVDHERVTQLTEAGVLTQKEMARELGCSTRTVRRHQRSECNVRRRPRRNPLTSKKVLDAAERLLPWF
ncbi:WhiB family transcriptional regulator [Streptomyces niveus]|uniref:WhiB family transcriptional regulator n=1 Tax=Streptomyces niveus TaxID=193462 RepID=UPI003429FC07